jgi:hypothetical protein
LNEQPLELFAVGMLAGGAVDVLVDDRPAVRGGESPELEMVLNLPFRPVV